MKKISIAFILIIAFFATSCNNQFSPFEANIHPLDGSYIIITNATEGYNATSMEVFINGHYIQNLAPGGSTVSLPLTPTQTYEIEGKSVDGIRLYPKTVNLGQSEEVVVILGS